jgi:Domain of unknown function (DUF4388)
MKGAAPASASSDSFLRQGELRSNTIPNLFHALWVARASGILTVADRETRKKVGLDKGRLGFASSNDRDDRLSQVLLREGGVPLKDLMKSLEIALATKDRVGEVMIRRKLMTPADVEKWVRFQVTQIVHSLFDWSCGQYQFEEQPAGSESVTIGLTGDAMVIEGVRRMRSWSRAFEEVGGLNAEYRTTRDAPVIVKELPLRPEDHDLLRMCDEPCTLEEMCEASRLSDYDVCKAVWGLLIVGALMKA